MYDYLPVLAMDEYKEILLYLISVLTNASNKSTPLVSEWHLVYPLNPQLQFCKISIHSRHDYIQGNKTVYAKTGTV